MWIHVFTFEYWLNIYCARANDAEQTHGRKLLSTVVSGIQHRTISQEPLILKVNGIVQKKCFFLTNRHQWWAGPTRSWRSLTAYFMETLKYTRLNSLQNTVIGFWNGLDIFLINFSNSLGYTAFPGTTFSAVFLFIRFNVKLKSSLIFSK